MEKAVKQTLFTLENSAKQHRKDGDKGQLKANIDGTLRELHEIADGLGERGYPRVSEAS